VCICVIERIREKRKSAFGGVRERERKSVCVCVIQSIREERESV
jgi:hypothetical protein